MLKKTLMSAAIAIAAATSVMAPIAEAKGRHGGHGYGHRGHFHGWGHRHYGFKHYGYGYKHYGHCKYWSHYGKYCIKW